MNRKHYREWSVDDPEVQAIFRDAIKSSAKSYYRIIDGKHRKALLRTELINLSMTSANASRLLQAFDFPSGRFEYNRKRDANVSAAEIAARREKTAQRAIAKAVRAQAEATLKIETMQAVKAEKAVENEEADGADEKEPKALAAEEQQDNKRYQLTMTNSGWWGVYDASSGSTRLTGKTKQSALEEIALRRKHREDIGYHWPTIRRAID